MYQFIQKRTPLKRRTIGHVKDNRGKFIRACRLERQACLSDTRFEDLGEAEKRVLGNIARLEENTSAAFQVLYSTASVEGGELIEPTLEEAYAAYRAADSEPVEADAAA